MGENIKNGFKWAHQISNLTSSLNKPANFNRLYIKFLKAKIFLYEHNRTNNFTLANYGAHHLGYKIGSNKQNHLLFINYKIRPTQRCMKLESLETQRNLPSHQTSPLKRAGSMYVCHSQWPATIQKYEN